MIDLKNSNFSSNINESIALFLYSEDFRRYDFNTDFRQIKGISAVYEEQVKSVDEIQLVIEKITLKGRIKLLGILSHGNPIHLKLSSTESFISYFAFIGHYQSLFDKLDSCAQIILKSCQAANQDTIDSFLDKGEILDNQNIVEIKPSPEFCKNRQTNNFFVDWKQENQVYRFVKNNRTITISNKTTQTIINQVRGLNVMHAISYLAKGRMVYASSVNLGYNYWEPPHIPAKIKLACSENELKICLIDENVTIEKFGKKGVSFTLSIKSHKKSNKNQIMYKIQSLNRKEILKTRVPSFQKVIEMHRQKNIICWNNH
jgi:hypothetical protein